MAIEYHLGDFSTGAITRLNLPLHKGTDKIEVTIHGGHIEIEVDFKSLPAEVRNNWRAHFVPYRSMIAAVDTDKAWDDPAAVLFAGFVDKVNSPVGKGFIRVQVSDVNEYLASLPAVRLYAGEIVDESTNAENAEEDEPVFASSSWGNLLRLIAAYAFGKRSDYIAPAGAPAPPSIIRNGLDNIPNTGSITKADERTGSKTFHTYLEEIRDEDSPSGIEWRFVPVWNDPARSAIKFDFITGTDAAPQINANNGVNVELSENSTQKISSFSSTFDGKEFYNKLFLKYEVPTTDGTTGNLKLRAFWNPNATGPVVAKFVNASTPLTDEQANALAAAYLKDGETGGLDISFTVEEQWDKSEWHGNVGKTVVFTGLPDTISAGQSVTVRCVGVNFSKQRGTVEATFMPVQTLYPRLPRQAAKRNAFAPAIKDISKDFRRVLTPDGREVMFEMPTGGGGGTTTPPPSGGGSDPYNPPWSNDGELSYSDLWGDEGRSPDDLDGPDGFDKIPDPIFADYIVNSTTITTWDGDYPIYPDSIVPNEGNRLYGLDHIEQGCQTRYDENGTATHKGGGINRETGMPVSGFRPFYIKKTYINDGQVGPVETVGQISVEKIQSLLGPWETHNAYNTSQAVYERGIGAVIWTVGGRLYAALGDAWKHYSTDPNTLVSGNQYGNAIGKWKTGGKVSVISIALDANTGHTTGEWRDELPFPNHGIPLHGFISKYGKNVIFSGFRACYGKIVSDIRPPDVDWMGNPSEAEDGWNAYSAANEVDGYSPYAYPMYIPVFGTQEEVDAGNIEQAAQSLGNLVKNYAEQASPYKAFLGFMQTETQKTGAVYVPGYITGGYFYGSQGIAITTDGQTVNRNVVARLQLTSSGDISSLATWEEIYSDEPGKYTAVRGDTGLQFAVSGTQAHNQTFAAIANYYLILDMDSYTANDGSYAGTTGTTVFKADSTKKELKRLSNLPFNDFFRNIPLDSQDNLGWMGGAGYNAYPLKHSTPVHGVRYALLSKTFSYNYRLYRLKLILGENGAYRLGWHSMKIVVPGETYETTSSGTLQQL